MRKAVIFLTALACILAVEAQESSCDGPHESVRCVPKCPAPWTCENRDLKYKCLPTNVCTHECVCDLDYYRNSKGGCVSYKECNSNP